MSCDIPSSSESSVGSVGTPSPRCEVCFLKGHGNHFGVITCRACAAFFRRMTVGTGQRQKCHYQNKCIPRDGRWFCKKCRLDKCHALGMTPENIQHNRDLFQCSQLFLEKRKKQDVLEDRIPTSLEKFVGVPQAIIHLRKDSGAKKTMAYVDVSPLVSKAEWILKTRPEFDPVVSKMTTLEKLTFGLKEVRKNQRSYLTEIRCIGKKETLNLWESQLLTTANWMMYFDEFRELPFHQKFAMLKCMWHIWGRLERLAMTAEMRVNRLCGKRQFVVTHDALIDYDLLEMDLEWSCHYTSEELKCFIDAETYYGEPLVEALIAVCPSDTELVFMLLTLCLRLTGKKLGGQIEVASDKLQEILSNGMHEYYTEKEGLPRYAHRLTKLLSFGNDWQGLMNKRREKFILAFILDAFPVSFSHPELFQYSV